jgi:NADH-quinone oxidoreductase subunit J
MEAFVFFVSAAIVIVGALGVVLRANPVHAALSLIMTLFGVAVLFVALQANFLAAVQVIVYAGAIVVLFLFVLMLLGVDRTENLRTEALGGQRPWAAVMGVCLLGVLLVALFAGGADRITGVRAVGGALDGPQPDVNTLAEAIFGTYVFAFEITSVLLVVAVLGTVLFARRPPKDVREEEQVEP